MSAQRRPATKRESTGSRRAGTGARSSGGGARAAATQRDERAEATAVEANGSAVAAAPAPRPASAAAARPSRPAAPKTVEREQQPSVLRARVARLRKIYEDTRAEMKKISWPDRETTRNLTIVVIGISVALGLSLGAIDYVLFQIFEALP